MRTVTALPYAVKEHEHVWIPTRDGTRLAARMWLPAAAEDVLAWIAEQPWCTGKVGMMGISWGGFAALQVAARQPEPLHAIVIASFTDDRYSDDVCCPVFAVSGWADGYSNAVFRLLRLLDVPRKGLIGPWSHRYPHLGEPGPAIGFLQEVVRWFDPMVARR